MTTSDLMIWATLVLSYAIWIIWLERDDYIADEDGLFLAAPFATRAPVAASSAQTPLRLREASRSHAL
jgi:hypothetical protein